MIENDLNKKKFPCRSYKQNHEYAQFKNEFVPWLSIIDILMFNTKEEVQRALDQYELIWILEPIHTI